MLLLHRSLTEPAVAEDLSIVRLENAPHIAQYYGGVALKHQLEQVLQLPDKYGTPFALKVGRPIRGESGNVHRGAHILAAPLIAGIAETHAAFRVSLPLHGSTEHDVTEVDFDHMAVVRPGDRNVPMRLHQAAAVLAINKLTGFEGEL